MSEQGNGRQSISINGEPDRTGTPITEARHLLICLHYKHASLSEGEHTHTLETRQINSNQHDKRHIRLGPANNRGAEAYVRG